MQVFNSLRSATANIQPSSSEGQIIFQASGKTWHLLQISLESNNETRSIILGVVFDVLLTCYTDFSLFSLPNIEMRSDSSGTSSFLHDFSKTGYWDNLVNFTHFMYITVTPFCLLHLYPTINIEIACLFFRKVLFYFYLVVSYLVYSICYVHYFTLWFVNNQK